VTKKTESSLLPVLVPAAKQSEIDTSTALATSELAAIASLPCETQADVDLINQLFAHVRGRVAALEEMRTTITQPLNAAKRAVDALFAPAKKKYEAAEALCRQKLADRAKRQLEAETARTAAVLAPVGAPGAPGAGVTMVLPEVPAAVVMTHARPVYSWKWGVDNIHKVPREYLCVDLEALRRHTDQYAKSDQIPPIEGIKFWRDVTIAAKG
jgi:hypothetical protein